MRITVAGAFWSIANVIKSTRIILSATGGSWTRSAPAL